MVNSLVVSGRHSIDDYAAAVLYVACGALPVSVIPVSVLGLLTMHQAAIYLVAPAVVAAVLIMTLRLEPIGWVANGFRAGLCAVAAYDAVRIPFVIAGIWPDFFGRLGQAIINGDHKNLVVGYLWRYFGDGGGIGVAWFVTVALLWRFFGPVVAHHPVAASVGFGVFIWSGLIFTVGVLPQGYTLFRLNPMNFMLSLIGHLVYGFVLGLFMKRQVKTVPPEKWPEPLRLSKAPVAS
jgi:hypothetical protein